MQPKYAFEGITFLVEKNFMQLLKRFLLENMLSLSYFLLFECGFDLNITLDS